ncbi:MAG: succinate dehydrogenase/fumarate reductase flavoprotein subunit, partial [Bacteroidales bacterium]|nr:succinate dehydrogenase/fumarate reductase flavoprotein subunit [Bacteroidales bacterium]
SALPGRSDRVERQAEAAAARFLGLLGNERGERLAEIRDAMMDAMEAGVGLYRTEDGLRGACAKLAGLRQRYRRGLKLDDKNRAFNTEWLAAIELGAMLEVAETMAHSALWRTESRGAHQRLDATERDDGRFLVHTIARSGGDGAPQIKSAPVTITKSRPASRVYGGAGAKAELT